MEKSKGSKQFKLDAETHAAVKQFAEITGHTMGYVVQRAVQAYMEAQGKVELEVAIERAQKFGDKVLSFPAGRFVADSASPADVEFAAALLPAEPVTTH